MIKWPKPGMAVFIYYKKSLQSIMPYHGKRAYILSVAKGKGPKNILVLINNSKVIVPRGNINLKTNY